MTVADKGKYKSYRLNPNSFWGQIIFNFEPLSMKRRFVVHSGNNYSESERVLPRAIKQCKLEAHLLECMNCLS